MTHIGKVDEAHIVLFFLLFFRKYLHSHVFFSKNWTKTGLFFVMSTALSLVRPHLQYTEAHSTLGDQIAYTVGHGAPGTFELMNYHLLHA